MFNWKEFEKTKELLSHSGKLKYKDDLGQHHIYLRPTELLDWLEFIKDDLGFFTLVDVAGFDLGENNVEIVYHILNMGSHQRLNIHLFANSGEVIPSVISFFSNADWMEREQGEMLNLFFDSKKDALLLPQKQKIFPLRKNSVYSSWPKDEETKIPKTIYNPNKSEAPYPEESYVWKKFDLLSKKTMGNFEWVVCFDPVKVVDSSSHIGFHHQGIEKLFEGKDVIQILHLVDKVNLSSAPSFSIAWAKTVEEMFRIKIPERAQALRLVMLELGRVADHLTVLSSICLESNQNEYKLFLNAREKIYELIEKYIGHRFGLGVAVIGGVKEDLPHGWIVEYQAVVEVLSKNLRLIHNSLVGQRKFRQLLEGEPVDAQSILQWGVSGPAMRAAGLNFDLRKSQPFYFYQDIDFDIPVGINGSTYDRYLIRYEEIFQSLRIMTQVLDNLPLGEVISPLFDKGYLDFRHTFSNLEQVRDWHYSALESPAGEAGFLVKFEESLKPARIKLKTPSFSMVQGLSVFVRGLTEDQISISLASLGVSRWELDR